MIPAANLLVSVELAPGNTALAEGSQAALDYALFLAKAWRSSVTVMTVLESSSWFGGQDNSERRESAERVLRPITGNATAAGVAATMRIAENRHAWEAIIQEALAGEHDLLVAGTVHRGSVSQMVYGSTGMKLLRYSPCPVLLARTDLPKSGLKILVADDFSEVAARGIDLAYSLAAATGGSVHLIHALDTTLERRIMMVGHEGRYETERQKQMETAETELNGRLRHHHAAELPPERVHTHVCEGAPPVVILKELDRLNIDLLLMGTHGRSGLAGVVLGNTAEMLFPQLTCSLLALKPAGYQTPVRAVMT